MHGHLQKKLHGTAVNLLRFERLSVDFMEDIQNLLHTTLAKWQAKNDIHLEDECHQVSNIKQPINVNSLFVVFYVYNVREWITLTNYPGRSYKNLISFSWLKLGKHFSKFLFQVFKNKNPDLFNI